MIEGRTITAVRVLDAKWVQPQRPEMFKRALCGRTIVKAGRRGKYFAFELDDDAVLVMHLRMTGNLLYLSDFAAVPATHLRGTFTLVGDSVLAFVDPRRFGTARVFARADEAESFFAARLGPEPFESAFNGNMLHAVTRRRKTSIKAVLLDQRTVAGIGNIYADEALYRAGISPRRRAARLTKMQCERLSCCVRDALRAGIDAKGASIDDFRDAYGVRGGFQDQFLVHRREGLPCPGCGSPVIKTVVAGRGTYFCRDCQRG